MAKKTIEGLPLQRQAGQPLASGVRSNPLGQYDGQFTCGHVAETYMYTQLLGMGETVRDINYLSLY